MNIFEDSSPQILNPLQMRAYFEMQKQSPEEILNSTRMAYITDLHHNGIPTKHFRDNGIIKYEFRGSIYEFDPLVLRVLDVVNRPYGSYSYDSKTPVMQVKNLAAVPVTLPCLRDGKGAVFTAQHRAATDLCRLWYQLHFDYVEILNTLTHWIEEYNFGPDVDHWDQVECDKFGVSLYGSPIFKDPARIKLP